MTKAITFDCAGTLVEVRQGLGQTLLSVASSLGVRVGWEEGGIFEALYIARLPAFHAANLLGPAAVREFYILLARDWLTRIGAEAGLAERLEAGVDEVAFGPDSPMFRLYRDTIPCLEICRARGLKVGVISNWDISLHRVLAMFGITPLVDFAVASLEFGHEKPDPRIFEFALASLGVSAAEAMHVGDDPVDDVQGPLAVGMQAVYLDRSGPTVLGERISTLADLFRELPWND